MASKKEKIDLIEERLNNLTQEINQDGEKLLAFGGSRATRTAILNNYTWNVRELELLKLKLEEIKRPWWERI